MFANQSRKPKSGGNAKRPQSNRQVPLSMT